MKEVDIMLDLADLEPIVGGISPSDSTYYILIVNKITGKKCPTCKKAFHQLTSINSVDLKELSNGRVRCPHCNKYNQWVSFN